MAVLAVAAACTGALAGAGCGANGRSSANPIKQPAATTDGSVTGGGGGGGEERPPPRADAGVGTSALRDAAGGDQRPPASAADAARRDGGGNAPDAARGPPMDAAPAGTPLPPVVPVVWLEAGGKYIPDFEKVTIRMKIIEEHDGSHKDLATRRPTIDTSIGINERGSYSASFPKDSYSIELRDAKGAEIELPVLGMPRGSDWVLYACYMDRSCLRNALAYRLGEEMGRWNPRFRFVEVYLDGKYIGLYNFIERIRRDRNRVDIPKPAADMRMGGDLSGGYIIRHEGAGAGPGRDWRSKEGIAWTYHYPRSEDVTAAQKMYLQDFVDKLEAAMKGKDFADPAKGYRAWFDLPSFVDFALAQELTRNWDGYIRSVYFTKQPDALGGLLMAGPLWDFDFAFGNLSLGDSNKADGWQYLNKARPPPNDVMFFFVKLWGDDGFRRLVRCRWAELRRGSFATAWIHARMDEWAGHIVEAVKRDQEKWKTIGKMIYPLYGVPRTYDEELATLKDWIAKRAAWLDENLPGRCD